MSEGLCPVLADEGWDWGNDDSVDEKPLGPCTLGKALQAQGLRPIAQAPHMMVSSQQLPFKLFWPLTAQMLLNSLSNWTKTQSRIAHVQLRKFSILDPSRKISSWTPLQVIPTQVSSCYEMSKRKKLETSQLKALEPHGACTQHKANNDPYNVHV